MDALGRRTEEGTGCNPVVALQPRSRGWHRWEVPRSTHTSCEDEGGSVDLGLGTLGCGSASAYQDEWMGVRPARSRLSRWRGSSLWRLGSSDSIRRGP